MPCVEAAKACPAAADSARANFAENCFMLDVELERLDGLCFDEESWGVCCLGGSQDDHLSLLNNRQASNLG